MLERIGLPEDDVTLLTTTRHLLMLDGVDKAVDTLLMQVESAFRLISQIVEIVHMNETVERRR